MFYAGLKSVIFSRILPANNIIDKIGLDNRCQKKDRYNPDYIRMIGFKHLYIIKEAQRI